jgi:prephenate dehydrogenase
LILKTIAPLAKPGTLICDVCSVKEEPVRWMKTFLPRYVSVLGTHPLFGPDSAENTIEDKMIVLCPVRISAARLRNIKQFLQRQGISVHQMSTKKHDQLMASTLFLTHFIGRGLLKLKLPPTATTTEHFKLLHRVARASGHDTSELFHDMYHFNRFAPNLPTRLIKELQKINSTLADFASIRLIKSPGTLK